jgi:hypothetical protein
MVWMSEEETRSNVARDSREVCSVVAVEYLLRTCSTDSRYELVVVVRVTTELPLCCLIRM